MPPATGFASVERSRIADARAALGELIPGSVSDSRDALWRRHVGCADDRALYWQRLVGLDALIASGASSQEIESFERGSRGMSDFTSDARIRVAVTGFDPFHLDTSIVQCNPSGLVALQLEGQRIAEAEIRTAIFPVRFADFDAGIVESVFESMVRGHELDLIISVSMGRDGFDLEHFPGLRRSSENPDNERLPGGGSASAPLVPAGLEDSPEFVEFSLPVDTMLKVSGDFEVRDNRRITTLEQGQHEARDLSALAGQTAVEGSGGGYLSNEISYRLVKLCEGSGIPVGHIHTPRLVGHDAAQLGRIVAQCRALIEAAVAAVAAD